jgi:hypothetical protein
MSTVADSSDGKRVSTTWVWKRCKVEAAPAQGNKQSAKQSTSGLRVRRDRWKPTTITVRYRGGPEASWLFQCGSLSARVPGWMAVEDALSLVVELRYR